MVFIRPKANSAFHPSGVGKWVPASAWKAKAGMVHSVSGWTRGVQVKLWDPLRTRAIPERLRGVFTTRRYTNTRRLPLPLPLWDYFLHSQREFGYRFSGCWCSELAAAHASSETDACAGDADESSSSPVCHNHRHQRFRYLQSQYHLLDAEHYVLKPLLYQSEHPGHRQLQLIQA